MRILRPLEQTAHLYDSFGKYEGTRILASHEKAWKSVYALDVEAFGRRPLDYAKFDQVVGSAYRSTGSYVLTELKNSEHPSMNRYLQFEDTGESRVRREGRYPSTIAYLFHYYRVLHEAKTEDPETIDRLLTCPPSLLLLNNDGLRSIRCCRATKLCPFCLSRQVEQLYQKVCNLCSEDEVLVKTTLSMPIEANWDLIRAGEADDEIDRTRRRLKRIHQDIKAGLSSDAGFCTFQLFPKMDETPTVLDDALSVTDKGVRPEMNSTSFWCVQRSQFVRQMSRCRAYGEGDIFGVTEIERLGSAVMNDPQVFAGGNHHTLRRHLFGTFPNPDLCESRDGLETVLKPPIQIGLPSPVIAAIASISRRTKMRQFDFHGRWRNSVDPGLVERARSVPDNRQFYKASLNAACGNSRPPLIALALRESINQVYREITVLGRRPPGRVKLKNECRARGVNCSDREARIFLSSCVQEQSR